MTASPAPLLWVTESAVRQLSDAAKASHPDETGGILLGVYAGGVPWVTRTVEIPTKERGPRRFLIPAGRTTSLVKQAREDDPRLGYLGDWHSHPADVGPSKTDLMSLGLVSVRHPRQPNPTLVVVRRRGEGRYGLDTRRIVTVRPRICVVTETGEPE
jgi:proteasome lid subunit RPN8/RPN11